MSSALQTVLEIAGVGTILLFLALAGLVGLMYSLTSPWLTERLNPSATTSTAQDEEDQRILAAAEQAKEEAASEADRQQKAVALAVAVAIATADRPLVHVLETSSAWRRLHQTRRLGQPASRQRARS
tara:strand:+ start:236 stop:616 length:381 start_codon:yes stop_codon:yes gene_type:complete